ncbi:hypothetical protein AMTRI_Chr09g34050 [Amborella trichopoda]
MASQTSIYHSISLSLRKKFSTRYLFSTITTRGEQEHYPSIKHAPLIKLGFKTDVYSCNRLIYAYSNARDIVSATRVFEEMPHRDIISYNTIISCYVRNACYEEAIKLFRRMHAMDMGLDRFTMAAILKACNHASFCLDHAHQLYAGSWKNGLHTDVSLCNAMISLFSQLGALEEARRVFNEMPGRDLVTWNAIIDGHSQYESCINAMGYFQLMKRNGMRPDVYTFVSVMSSLDGIASMDFGIQVHGCIEKSPLCTDTSIGNSLIGFYTRTKEIDEARKLFELIPSKDMVSWNALIAGYSQNGISEEAWELFCWLRREAMQPNSSTYTMILCSCAVSPEMSEGNQVHALLEKSGFDYDIFVGTALIDFYAKCGTIEDARECFERMPQVNLISFNTLISGYSQNGRCKEALDLFSKMQELGTKPDRFTFSGLLNCFIDRDLLKEGEQVHCQVIKLDIDSDACVADALVSMYANFQEMDNAQKVFDSMLYPDIVSWNSMISKYVLFGYMEDSYRLFARMRQVLRDFDEFTLSSLLKASLTLEQGRMLHALVIVSGLVQDEVVISDLIHLYTRNKCIEDALMVYNTISDRNEMVWNSFLISSAQIGAREECIKVYSQGLVQEMRPREFALGCIIRTCGRLPSVNAGKQIHTHIIKFGIDITGYAGIALRDMYSSCGCMDSAKKVHDAASNKDIHACTEMMVGYARRGLFREAWAIYPQLEEAFEQMDEQAIKDILRVAASVASISLGKKLHGFVLRHGYETDHLVTSGLISMYSKCGSIRDAAALFEHASDMNIVTCNAMIAGYSRNGCSQQAIQLFEQMKNIGVEPNDISFVGVLSACCRRALFDHGLKYFDSMVRVHGIVPRAVHYACMVDLLARARHLDMARNFIERMPIAPDESVWRTMLGASRMHGDINLAEQASRNLLELNPRSSSTYVLLSNVYASAGRWDDVARVRGEMKSKGIRKEPGSSSIEYRGEVHVFFSDDGVHPLLDEIHLKLVEVIGMVRETGYIPDTRFSLQELDEDQKEHSLLHHSEKLALAFGLLKMPTRTPIRIINNLRVCGDCHTAFKCISKILNREVILRDTSQFHHFQSGSCSCGDYW